MAGAISFRPFTEQDALTAASWRYPEPYSAYDMDPWDRQTLQALLHHEHQYHAVLRQDEMVGYFCIGKDARVPGWDYDESALDFGMGLRPDVIGQGNARLYLNAILEFLDHQWPGKGIRATVASWNQRAVRACSHFGFRQISAFVGVTGQRLDYVVLLRD